MSVLTTSQLTFCDLKDSYSIHVDTEYIGLACNNKGLVLDNQNITINYRAFTGQTIVGVSCVVSGLPSGVTLVSNTPSSVNEDGSIVLNISEGATLNDETTSSAKFIFTTNDNNKFIFEKYITFIKSIAGYDGTDAVNFQIYSVNGFEFSDEISSIELKTVALQKGSPILSDSVTYKWKWWNPLSELDDKYEEISGEVSNSLIINATDEYALTGLKCEMTYNGIVYEDYISLTKKTAIYTSVVKFANGSNIFMDDPYIIAYVELYQDNNLIETIVTQSYYIGNNSISSSGVITTDMTGEFSNGDLVYFIYKENNLYNVVLGEYSSLGWNVVEDNLQYTYTNTLYQDTQSNIIVISKESIDKSKNIDFIVYHKGVTISRTNATVIDINDPIISIDAPENPKYGQLWLDTSVTPYRLMIFTQVDGTETGKWSYFSQQNGKNVYTSKPTQYIAGDLWILADGEYYPENNPIYMAGSILRADENLNWVDAISDITGTVKNVKESFVWDNTGIKVMKKVVHSSGNTTNPFYVHIDSTRMGFHSVEYNTSGQEISDVEVVHIGNNSATIQNATFQGGNGTKFENNVTFEQQMNIYKPNTTTGFTWKIEENGSLSLAISI